MYPINVKHKKWEEKNMSGTETINEGLIYKK